MQCQQVGRGDGQTARSFRFGGQIAVVFDAAIGRRVLNQHTAQAALAVIKIDFIDRADLQIDAQTVARVCSSASVCG